ncbi:MAG TPA: ABC transporter permease [Candidatus Dormibacteraeota bacterium]|nr:ABC transporter permease [Candidatus Dormibacteraeota bacterium]
MRNIAETPLADLPGMRQMRPFLGATRAELIKIDKRPSVWILLGVALALLVLLEYVLYWFLYSHPPHGTALPAGVTPAQMKAPFYPSHMVSTTTQAGTLPGALALILGVLLVGSEYGWGTFKTLFTQRPGRLQTLLAKLAALEIALGAAVVLFFAVAAMTSIVLALIDGQPAGNLPDGLTILRAMLASWLVWSWWALFGSALAFIFQQSALAIGLGLAYDFLIEGLLFSFGGALGGDFLHNLERVFPGVNATALLNSFFIRAPGNAAGGSAVVGAGQATIVLLIYCAAAVVVAGVLVTRRDIK